MLVAAIFLIFFCVDIFICTQFQNLGLVPMSYFVSGIGLFYLIHMRRSFKREYQYNKSNMLNVLYIGMYFYVILVSVNNFILGIYSFTQTQLFDLDLWFEIQERIMQALLLYSIILFALVIFYIFRKNNNIMPWILCASAGALMRNTVQFLFESRSIWLYKNMGLFDLPMLFGWLMIIIETFRREYQFDTAH